MRDKIIKEINRLKKDIINTKQKLQSSEYINDYRKARMKAYITKSKEIVKRLEKILEEEE